MPVISTLLLTLFGLCLLQFRPYLIPATTPLTSERFATRVVFFDFVRGIAILAVILIHVCTTLIDTIPDKSTGALFINALSRFAIGVFFIVSGALLNEANSNASGLKDFFVPKIIRIGIPYFICSALVCVWGKFQLSDFALFVINGKALTPYYFIPLLFQFYLIFPLIVSLKTSKYFLISTLLFSSAIYFFIRTPEIFGIPFIGRHLFFFAYGIAHRERLLRGAPLTMLWVPITLVVAYLFLVAVGSGMYGNEQYLYSISVFEIALYLFQREILPEKFKKLLLTIGAASLWIFLVHYPITVYITLGLSAHIPAQLLLIGSFSLSALVSSVLAMPLHYLYQKYFIQKLHSPPSQS